MRAKLSLLILITQAHFSLSSKFQGGDPSIFPLTIFLLVIQFLINATLLLSKR
jgi:hypothetical protein